MDARRRFEGNTGASGYAGGERYIRLTDVPRLKFLPKRRNKKRLHPATIFRWAQRGVHGIKLQTVQIGGTRCTTIAMLGEFFDALDGVGPAGDPTRLPAEINRSDADAAHLAVADLLRREGAQ